jgi:hypothetical protein
MNTLLSIGSIAVTSIALNLIPIQQVQAVNLVQNGDFSTNGGTGQIGYNTTLGSWASTGYNFIFNNDGTADTTGAANSYNNQLILWGPNNTTNPSNNGFTAASPAAGGAFIAADGDSGLHGAISQQLSGLDVGQQYSVSFWDAAAQQYGYDGATTDQWEVSFISTNGTQTQLSSGDGTGPNGKGFSLPNHGFSGWRFQNLTFTATDATATLSFLALGTPNGLPPFSLLAGVAVQAVPEPNTFVGTLVSLGFLGIVLKSRLARKKLDE